MVGKVTAEQLAEIKSAPEGVLNKELALRFGITPQYVSMIRKGVSRPLAARIPADEAEAKLIEIRGMSTMIQKRAQAVDDAMDCVLLSLQDLKQTPISDKREKRLALIVRALRDIAEATGALRGSASLGEMSDADVRAALAVEVAHG
jgi:transcriptional regulator with XRE-family HTH domain